MGYLWIEQEKQFYLNDDTHSHLKGECSVFFQEILTWKMYKARKDAVRISTLFSGRLKKTCGKCGCN